MMLEKEALINAPTINSNQNLKHSIFNLYAQPIIPESSQESLSNVDRSMMNLFLEKENSQQSKRQDLSRSVFNLSQNI